MTMVPTQGKSCCNRCFLFFSRSRLLPSALLVAAESLAADTFFLHMRQSKNGGNRTLKMVVTTYLIETAHHFINCWWRGNLKTVELYGLIPALISFFFVPRSFPPLSPQWRRRRRRKKLPLPSFPPFGSQSAKFAFPPLTKKPPNGSVRGRRHLSRRQ